MAQLQDRIIKSKTEPNNTNVIWIDVSLKKPAIKVYNNGQWQLTYADIDVDKLVTDEELQEALLTKQDALVSGQNIKTINGLSIVGSGDVLANTAFKGWFDNLAALQAKYSNPYVGDFAYVHDASPATTVSIYRCATAGTWADSGDDVDTSLVQTFASGQPLNEVHIVKDLTTGGVADVLSAEQGKEIGEILDTLNFDMYGGTVYQDQAQYLVANTYYNLNGSTIKNTATLNNCYCLKLPCQAGDVFRVYGYGAGNYSRLYAFANSNQTTLVKADGDTNTRTNGLVLTAPTNAAFLVVNLCDYNSQTDKVEKVVVVTDCVTNNLSKITDDVYGEKEYQDQVSSLIPNKYYALTGEWITGPNSINGTYCVEFECEEGDMFRVYGRSYAATRLYAFGDGAKRIITVSDEDLTTRGVGLILTAPINARYVAFNFFDYNVNTDKVEKLVTVKQGVVDSVEELNKHNSGLVGKNIVVFGDSLSEFHNTEEGSDGKGWIDYAEEISGANIINIAIGGTQIKQRYSKLPTLFDSTKPYNIGDWVFYKPSSTMNCYECTTQHSGAWDGSDFSEVTYNVYLYAQLDIVSIISAICNTNVVNYSDRLVDTMAAAQCVADHMSDNNTSQIQRLIYVDWSTIDAVIIMAGGNDFGSSAFGETDSSDKMKESGAINEIVRLMSSTYKNVPIYYSTDTVRWFNYSSGSGADADWGDVYVPSGGTLNYREFFAAVVNQFKIHHIPTIDLYNTLGWNKWNFSNFFTDNDGTHPYKGFRQIAERIVSGIIANKVF